MNDTSPIAPAEDIKSIESTFVDEPKSIELSDFTLALLESVKQIKPQPAPDDISKLSVSQAVSFLAIAYEKVRNAIEYREDHLVLRAAIERILKRRLALNSEGKGEAENLLRELLWARYFPNESFGETQINQIQSVINKYLKLKNLLLEGKHRNTQVFLFQFLFDLLTCEIEEKLNTVSSKRTSIYTYFIFQTLHTRLKVEELEDDKKDAFLLVALDKAFRKSDKPYLRYHLYTTFYQVISEQPESSYQSLVGELPAIFKRIDEIIVNPNVDSLTKYVKKRLPPFLILFDILNEKKGDLVRILNNRDALWSTVESACNKKYKQIGARLRNLALRSLIYIFATKMVLALILEYPVSMFFYGEANKVSIIINTVTPPILMLIIVLFFKLPGLENTKNIYNRITTIIDKDTSNDIQIAYIKKKNIPKRSVRIFAFTLIYSLTFLITFTILHRILVLIGFNLVSEAVFIFFISVISFFSYRIKQVSNEYKLQEREGIFSPVIDFFFMPFLAVGKFLSQEISRLNIFILIFDFIIEAPFKLVIEVFEEWIKFIRARKEEIV